MGQPGWTHSITPPERLARCYPPKSIGWIKDGHNVLPGNAWDSTFEPVFDEPDNAFPTVVGWLNALYRKPLTKPHRAHAPAFPEEIRSKLIRCLASLIVRNPTMREGIRQSLTHIRRSIGLIDAPDEQHLLLVNSTIQHLYDDAVKRMETGGKFAFLYAAPGREFIFGDGFLHSFPHARGIACNPTWLIPLSPVVSVLWFMPESCWPHPRTITIPLTEAETAFCNETIQIYSKDYVYYRAIEPQLTEGFTCGEHRAHLDGNAYHIHPILEALKDEVLHYYLPKQKVLSD